MGIKLITDSTCDLSPDELKAMGVRFAPLKVLFGEEEFADKIDLSDDEFYEKMRNSATLPTTSQVNPNEFFEMFEEEIEKGNQIIGIFISSDLSGTYNSACIAKDMLASEDIFLIDSRTASFSLGLMVRKIQASINAGKDVKDILKEADEMVQTGQLYGMLDTLENLRKGGRLSNGAAMIGKMLNLKPIIEVVDGVVKVAYKARGDRKGASWMIEQLSKEFPTGEIEELAIAHANAYDKLEQFRREIEALFKVKNIYEVELGSVIGTHTGEGVVGIAFFRKAKS